MPWTRANFIPFSSATTRIIILNPFRGELTKRAKLTGRKKILFGYNAGLTKRGQLPDSGL
jgi:hypothetical protein